MHLMCKACKGNSERFLDKFRCPLCKKNRLDYKKAGLEYESDEMGYLYTTWLKVRGFNMATTGIKKLDALLEGLWGKPHTNDWRNYAKFPVRETSPHVILRTVNLGRVERVEEPCL
jgi:transposase-like protein